MIKKSLSLVKIRKGNELGVYDSLSQAIMCYGISSQTAENISSTSAKCVCINTLYI